ncbi:hypothetical protein GF314_11145 [bacterium]|nr:hypothetical protein [bacterium]
MTGPDGPRSILVALPNWLGDVVMASDLLGDLVAARDGAGRPYAIHVSVRRRWSPLVEGDPRLTGVHCYQRDGRHAGTAGLVRLAREWRRLGVDAVVLGPPSLRAALAARLAGIPVRVGEATGGRSWLLTPPVATTRPPRSRHHADELRDLASAVVAELGGTLPTPAPGDRSPRWPALEAIAPRVLEPGPPLWVLAPGATYGPAKVWPVDNQAVWLRLAVGRCGRRVALTGDPQSRELASALRARTADLPWHDAPTSGPGVVDLTGRTSLPELIAWLRAAEAYVGNDSGVMHLSAALGLPTLGLFGSSSVTWTAPRGPRALALAADGFPCQPCFRRECDQPRFCLETITAERVVGILEQLLDRAPDGGAP